MSLFVLLDVVILLVVPLRRLRRGGPASLASASSPVRRAAHEKSGEDHVVTRRLGPSATPGPRVDAYGRTPSGWAVMVVAVGQATVPYEPPPSSLPSLVVTERLFDARAEPAEAPEPSLGAKEGDEEADGTSEQEGAVSLPVVLVLGSVRIENWRVPPDPARERVVTELSCYLALHRDRPVQGEVMRAAVWSDELGPEASARTLRDYLSHARAALGSDVLPPAGRGRGYKVTDLLDTDWARFCRLVEKADQAEEGEVVGALEEALSLVRGRPFEDVDYAWAHREHIISAMEVAIISAARRLGHMRLASARADLASDAALRGLLAAPYDLSLWSLLFAAAERQGPDAQRGRGGTRALLSETGSRSSRRTRTIRALPVSVGTSRADPRRPDLAGPRHPTGVEQHPEAVVLEVGQPTAG